MLAKLTRIVTNIGDDERILSYHHFAITEADIYGGRSLRSILHNMRSFEGSDLFSIRNGFAWMVFDIDDRYSCALNKGVNSYLVLYDAKRKATVAGDLPEKATPWELDTGYRLRPRDCGLIFKDIYPHIEGIMRRGTWCQKPEWDYSRTVWGFYDRTPSGEVSQKLLEMPYREFDDLITHTFATVLLRTNSMWYADEDMLKNAYHYINSNVRSSRHRMAFEKRFEPYMDSNEDPSVVSFLIERELEEEALDEAKEYAYDFYFLFNPE